MNGTLSATFAATRKIPEPITEPTTAENAASGPSTRGNLTSTPFFLDMTHRRVLRSIGETARPRRSCRPDS